ncbi:MAG TPA: hypothetical protein VJW20_23075 [Candidatus Angelobacter sp.]|nr:hypothetical protein [Candidatus Angelobacter sp.]
MAGHRLKGLRAAAFWSIAIAALIGGCNRERSSPATPRVAANEVSELTPALIGKQITIHGQLSLRCKEPVCIGLDNHQVVYLVHGESFNWGKPAAEMDGKRVAVTGILRFYHDTNATGKDETVQRPPDHYYFEAETTQVRLVSH